MQRTLKLYKFKPISNLRNFASVTNPPKKTSLYDLHVEKGGKMVEFAGYSMPVVYNSLSITQSHLHTRESVSVFDVSHMLQSEVHGKNRATFMELLVTGDICKLEPQTGTLTLFTNEKGGIIDDLIVSNTEKDHLYVVSNAGCRHKDIPLMENAEKEAKAKGHDVKFVPRDDLSLLAVQGPKAASVVQKLTKLDLSQLYFMRGAYCEVGGIRGCRITRCGYTGEDGMEISVPNEHATQLLNILLSSQVAKVELAGLGARDSLRLEAGLCLYGNDMDEGTSPPEAALSWLIGKTRRERGDFPGANIILQQLKDKTKMRKKRIGIITKDGPPPRSHMPILSQTKEVVGEITSGVPSPSLGYNVAMGYVKNSEEAKIGSSILIQVRNKIVEGIVTKMPFLKGKYYNPTK